MPWILDSPPFCRCRSQVIFFTDPVDEYLMQYLMDYEDKKFQNVSKEGLSLGKDSKSKDLKEAFKDLTKWWKDALAADNVDSVKISNRLSGSPCVVVTGKYGWSANMERIMQSQTLSDSSKQAYMKGKRVLEINPRHPIIKELRERVANDPKVTDRPIRKMAPSSAPYLPSLTPLLACGRRLFRTRARSRRRSSCTRPP